MTGSDPTEPCIEATGVCDCKDGYTGATCSECDDGYFFSGNGECIGNSFVVNSFEIHMDNHNYAY